MAPITRWEAVAAVLGVVPETVRRARRKAGDKRLRSCWFANEDEVRAWWRALYVPERLPEPAPRPRRNARSKGQPLDVAALRAELAGDRGGR